jgi:hypothetical protein
MAFIATQTGCCRGDAEWLCCFRNRCLLSFENTDMSLRIHALPPSPRSFKVLFRCAFA